MQTSKVRGARLFNHSHFLIVVGWLIVLSVAVIMGLGLYAFISFSSPQYPDISDNLNENGFKLYEAYIEQVNQTFRFMSSAMGILMATLIFVLMLLALQMYAWHTDRKRLLSWRENGFLCERLEFLPGNRLRLNNIEIQLNRTQHQNFCQLVRKRLDNMPLHALDIGEHGVQSIKRLREELGSKFIEQAFIKVKKGEGYWLEVEPASIRGLTPDEE
ncbi:MAG: hypothetical protein KJ914_10910 [Gammaproteobacteria bacterium]|nr:hypothetical protein [Gammaproteobacteria bacterium]MBU1723464.1 hypothetical protein [Gammaproteobacteria bacterium]MBU2004414.1 hypothetical protein [Gammaproteobacteria bacterium]